MLSVEILGDSVDWSLTTRPPSIYFDHWALRLFSSKSEFRDRFLALFKTKGTLFFSWLNVLELSRNTGESADLLKIFLAEIKEHWFPMEINPFTVMEREVAGDCAEISPCVGAGFLKAYYPYIHEKEISLGTVVELVDT